MDTVTQIIQSIDIAALREIGLIINDAITYAVIVIALLFLGEQRMEKRKKVLLAIAISIIAAYAIKEAMSYERPCAGQDWCPGGYSFPSAHTVVAFTLMVAFLNKRNYIFYLLFAIFVAFSRINIGVHTFYDVVAALPIALMSYYIANILWGHIVKYKAPKTNKKAIKYKTEEFQRQIIHLIIGLLAIAFLFYFGRGMTIGVVFTVIIAGTFMINAQLLGIRIRLLEWIEARFERKDVLFPGWGSACYAGGVLIPLIFLTDINQIAAIIFILATGDGFSTIIGRNGKILLPYNKKKTLEGSLAFVIASLPAYYFIGFMIIPLAVIATIIESIDWGLDDNIIIPIVGTAFLLVI